MLSNLKTRFERNLIYVSPGAGLLWVWVKEAAAFWGQVGSKVSPTSPGTMASGLNCGLFTILV